jgi:hypothetical protein
MGTRLNGKVPVSDEQVDLLVAIDVVAWPRDIPIN